MSELEKDIEILRAMLERERSREDSTWTDKEIHKLANLIQALDLRAYIYRNAVIDRVQD